VNSWKAWQTPTAGKSLFRNQETLPLLAFLSAEEREARLSTKVIYHGLPPDGLPVDQPPQRSSFRHGVPPKIQEKVLRDWQRYGYRDG
jgi:4-hydroxy-3-polyprenylbenzoate decarboxylase